MLRFVCNLGAYADDVNEELAMKSMSSVCQSLHALLLTNLDHIFAAYAVADCSSGANHGAGKSLE
jgi:hypothetical protein